MFFLPKVKRGLPVYSLIQIKHYSRKVRTVCDNTLAGSGRENEI